MRSLILGATGLIGSHLVDHCDDRGGARLGTWYRSPKADHVPLDLRDADAVSELIADYQPDVTFLAAGLTDAGYAETFPAECPPVTVDGARHVAEAVARHGGTLAVFSSDEVFGDCPTARREDDPAHPTGVLARCQLEAERLVRRELPGRHLILRSSWVFGPEHRGRNPVSSWVRRLACGEAIEAATDRDCQPTYAADLAEIAVELAKLGQSGTYHVVGPDRHTAFTFARLVAHIYGFDSDLVDGRTTRELGDRSPRPGRVWLDRFKLRSLLGARAVRTAADGLRTMRDAARASYTDARAA